MTMGVMRSDADLVGAFTSGDSRAFGEIYDRHAGRVHDYCWAMLRSDADAQDAAQDTMIIASRRLPQLRDPAKLRPWLLAIARNECRRRGTQRKRVVPVDEVRESHASHELTANDDPTTPFARAQTAALVWDAAASLPERDQELMHLHLRQGLSGQELAHATGLPLDQCYVALSRMRDKLATSLGALLVARQGRQDCDDLQQLLTDWDGTFSSVWRKRVARHVEDCSTCSRTRARLFQPGELLAYAAQRPLPPALRDVVLAQVLGTTLASHDIASRYSWDDAGFPFAVHARRRRVGLWVAVAGAALLLAVVALTVGKLGDEDTDTKVRSRPASTSEFRRSITTSSRASVSSAAPDSTDNPLAGLPPGLNLNPPSSSSSPASSTHDSTSASTQRSRTSTTPSTNRPAKSTTSVPRVTTTTTSAPTTVASSEPSTTAVTETSTTASRATTTSTTTTSRAERLAVKVSASPADLRPLSCPTQSGSTQATVTADVSGGTAPYSVGSDHVTLSGGPTHFSATFGPVPRETTITVNVTVSDSAGQQTSGSVTLTVSCPNQFGN